MTQQSSTKQSSAGSGEPQQEKTTEKEPVSTPPENMRDNSHTIRRSQHRHVLPVPYIYLSTADIQLGDEVGVAVSQIDAKLCLVIDRDAQSGTTEEVRAERNTTTRIGEIPIPADVMQAGGLFNAAVTYTASAGQVIAITNQRGHTNGHVTLQNAAQEMLLPYRRNYPVELPDPVTDSVQPDETVWLCLGAHTDGLIFCIDVREEDAPPEAVPLSVSRANKFATEYTVRIPEQIVTATRSRAKKVTWGHDNTRIVGLIGG